MFGHDPAVTAVDGLTICPTAVEVAERCDTILLSLPTSSVTAGVINALGQAVTAQTVDGRNKPSGKKPPTESAALARYALFEKTAPRPETTSPVDTRLPLKVESGMSIAFIGNTLLDRAQDFGYLETMIQQAYPGRQLTVRNLAWSADSLHHQPRPANFADTDQHLVFCLLYTSDAADE